MQTGDGPIRNVSGQVSAANPLDSSPVDHWARRFSEGVNGAIVVHKFGYADATVTETDINYGITPIPWPTSASRVRIKAGGNANDDAAGTGAQSVFIQGLDENGVIQTEEVATAGASASAYTTTTFRRDFRAYVGDVGAYTGTNAGDITIENETPSDLLIIPAGYGQTFAAQYTVPTGYTAYMYDARARVEGTKSATVTLWQRLNGSVTGTGTQAKRAVRRALNLNGGNNEPYTLPIKFTEDTDIWASASTTSGTSRVEVSFDFVLIPNG